LGKRGSINADHSIIEKNQPYGANDEPGYWIHIRSSNLVAFGYEDSGNTNYEIFSTKTISDQNFHQIVATYDEEGRTSKIYIDGELNASDIFSNPIGSTTRDITVGARTSNSLGYDIEFNGTIDELVIYNYTLTPKQILALYENRTDTIVPKETEINDVWTACITPNDGTQDGLEKCTSVTIADLTNLTIYDETDYNGGYNIRGINQTVDFYANYSYYNVHIIANCSINFSDWEDNLTYCWNQTNSTNTSLWFINCSQHNNTMEFNPSTGLYSYTRRFLNTTYYNWTVTCEGNETFTDLMVNNTVYIEDRSESEIRNLHPTNITGYVSLKVQYYDGGTWVDDSTVYLSSSPVTIPQGVDNQIRLKDYWTGWDSNNQNHGTGTYRVYGALVDDYGVAMVNLDGSSIEDAEDFYLNVPSQPSTGGGSSSGGGICEDDCSSSQEGDDYCYGSYVLECGNFDQDSCLDERVVQACTSNEVCSNAQCSCSEDWFCGDWSLCSDLGRHERECVDMNACGTELAIPLLEGSCTRQDSCNDGIRNQGEERTDCGGPCAPCEILLEEPIEILSPVAAITGIDELGGCTEIFQRQSNTSLQRSAASLSDLFRIPEGYSMILEPFNIDCQGDSFVMTLSIPENYTDVRALKCSGDECSPTTYETTSEFVCGFEVEREVVREKEFIEVEEMEVIKDERKVITKEDNEITIGRNKIIFSGDITPGLEVKLGSPERAIAQPFNPSLGIIGTPVVVTIDEKLKGEKLSAEITIPYTSTTGYEAESLAIYHYNIKDGNVNWTVIEGSKINSEAKTITINIEDIREYLNSDGTATFANVGVVCEICEVSEFKKVYHYPGSRDAIILIHGLGSSPATYDSLIADMEFNNQPWQIWTLGYSSNRVTDITAEELMGHLEAHSQEYDRIFIVAHSLGTFVTQKALYNSYLEKQKDPEAYTFLDKVRRAILIGGPNDGSPGAEVYKKLFKYLVNVKSRVSLFDTDSKVIEELVNGINIPRVPGIEYYVLAGTKAYEFTLGLFKLQTEEMFEFYEKNDGLVTVSSAQHIGDTYINNSCYNYFEINVTHTDLLNAPASRKVIEKTLSEAVSEEAEGKVLLGFNQYFKLAVENCNPDNYYVVIGKSIRKEKVFDELNCLCGNGYCGEGEDATNCPVDCARLLTTERINFLGPMIIYLIIGIAFLLSMVYVLRKFVAEEWVSYRWNIAIYGFVVLSAMFVSIYKMSFATDLPLALFGIVFITFYTTSLDIYARVSGLNLRLEMYRSRESIQGMTKEMAVMNNLLNKAVNFKLRAGDLVSNLKNGFKLRAKRGLTSIRLRTGELEKIDEEMGRTRLNEIKKKLKKIGKNIRRK